MRHEKSMDLKGNTAGTSLYGVRNGKKSQTPQPELRQGVVHGNNSCVVHHDSGAGICDSANGLDDMEGGARMTQYTEIYPFKVEDEIKAGTMVDMLDKQFNSVQTVNYLNYEAVIKILADETGRYYFWKKEVVVIRENTEKPQTENAK